MAQKRIRETIVKYEGKPIEEVITYFEKSYMDWMGDSKQIDDVLLLGVKF